jgi:hypothetical protein
MEPLSLTTKKPFEWVLKRRCPLSYEEYKHLDTPNHDCANVVVLRESGWTSAEVKNFNMYGERGERLTIGKRLPIIHRCLEVASTFYVGDIWRFERRCYSWFHSRGCSRKNLGDWAFLR